MGPRSAAGGSPVTGRRVVGGNALRFVTACMPPDAEEPTSQGMDGVLERTVREPFTSAARAQEEVAGRGRYGRSAGRLSTRLVLSMFRLQEHESAVDALVLPY